MFSETNVEVVVADGDDRRPKFTRRVYKAQIWEDFPITVGKI